jgi:hypothetical protein
MAKYYNTAKEHNQKHVQCTIELKQISKRWQQYLTWKIQIKFIINVG